MKQHSLHKTENRVLQPDIYSLQYFYYFKWHHLWRRR